MRRFFCRTSLVLALAFWGAMGQSARQVRAALSEQATFDGDDWAQLPRWSRAAASGALFSTTPLATLGTPRVLAGAVIGLLRALAPAFVHGSGAVPEALAGARRLR